jgi:hypothetical protein
MHASPVTQRNRSDCLFNSIKQSKLIKSFTLHPSPFTLHPSPQRRKGNAEEGKPQYRTILSIFANFSAT